MTAQTETSGRDVVVDQQEFRASPGAIAGYRAALALVAAMCPARSDMQAGLALAGH